MPQDSPRIAELRRRVHADPASIAFAQLAEEYRRAGHYQEAVKYCRAGLARHSGYLSARVTLGRSLMELGELDDASHEFDLVLRSAPDNLAAIRNVAEIHQRRGDMAAALDYYTRALALARFDPELEESVNRIARELGRVESLTPEGLSFEEASTELRSAASRMPAVGSHQPEGPRTEAPMSGESSTETLIDFDALLASLGMPDRTPPPGIERLMSEPAGPPAQVAKVRLELPMGAAAGDPFAVLEQELRSFEARPARAGAEHQSDPPRDAADDRVVEELEAWLRVLADDSAATPPA